MKKRTVLVVLLITTLSLGACTGDMASTYNSSETKEAADDIKDAFSDIKESFSDTKEDIKDSFSDTKEDIKESLGEAQDALGEAGSDTKEAVAESGILDDIQSGIDDIQEDVKEELGSNKKDSGSDTPADASMSQLNAIKSAKSYLSFSGFSKQGLIDQLSSEYGDQFPVEDAKYAVDFLESIGFVDWKEQAIKSAKSYLDFSSFSKQGLIDQLSSDYGDKYTKDIAAAAVDYLEQNGMVDWKEQAAKSAKKYLDFTSFSRQGLIDQLTSEYGDKFTLEQAEYGVSQVGL